MESANLHRPSEGFARFSLSLISRPKATCRSRKTKNPGTLCKVSARASIRSWRTSKSSRGATRPRRHRVPDDSEGVSYHAYVANDVSVGTEVHTQGSVWALLTCVLFYTHVRYRGRCDLSGLLVRPCTWESGGRGFTVLCALLVTRHSRG
jgi:hypothetical protein